ncbi:ISAzo13 family transposase [soil metagenome]
MALAEKFALLSPHLDERQRRLWAGAEARALGRGGMMVVARTSGLSLPTVRKGMRELEAGGPPLAGVRRPGGGRKSAVARDPELPAALERLVSPDTRGDPESPLRWTTKSTRTLSAALGDQGHSASRNRVAELLHAAGYSLQGNRKTIEGRQHPDRDAQFGYINDLASRYLAAGLPVVSVDAKKKELVGDYKNAGRQWRPAGDPVEATVHDFPDPTVGKAVPYGVYDIAANQGFVAVGQDGDTAAFAVHTLRRWWQAVGDDAYPGARRLLVCADAGGSNGYRLRLFKTELARLAEQTALKITVCHFPPGTSKWNKIEHRLFSQITSNWRGEPLTSHQVVVDLIGATTTRTGLTIRAERDTGTYPRGTKVSDAELAAVRLQRHLFHGDWNYTVRPSPASVRTRNYTNVIP